MRRLVIAIGIASLSVLGIGCEDSESAGDAIKDAASKVGDAIEDTGKKLGEKMEEAKEDMRDAADELEE